MPEPNIVNELEQYDIAPPSGTVADQSIPLTFFDIWWIPMPSIRHVLFYEFPVSKSHFMETITPSLKTSLSLALKHFFPLVGNLVFPLDDSNKPEIRYVDGQSIPLTFAESSNDFSHLTGYHARNADEFHPLVPQLPCTSTLSESISFPLMAIQVTLFPDLGICIGFNYHHLLGDGKSFLNFIRWWASITKLGGDETLLASEELPLFDRTVIKDPSELHKIYWEHVRKKKFNWSQLQTLPTNKVRATFVMSKAQIQILKDRVVTKYPTLSYVSTFTVACAYTWACKVQAIVKTGEEGNEDELRHFSFPVDCRERLDPPVPQSYFGNCVVPCYATTKSTLLIDKDGFVVAAKLIREVLQEKLHNEIGVLKDAEILMTQLDENLKLGQRMGVSGSHKFLVNEIDFGWGRPKKSEILSIDLVGAMSLTDSRDFDGGLEIGMCLNKNLMDAFTTIFTGGLLQEPKGLNSN